MNDASKLYTSSKFLILINIGKCEGDCKSAQPKFSGQNRQLYTLDMIFENAEEAASQAMAYTVICLLQK